MFLIRRDFITLILDTASAITKCPSCHLTHSVKALKEVGTHEEQYAQYLYMYTNLTKTKPNPNLFEISGINWESV